MVHLKLKVAQYRLSIGVLEDKHIILVLIIRVNALALQSILLSHVLALLTVLLLLCALFLQELSLLSALPLNSLLVLSGADLGVLFVIVEALGCALEGTLTKLILTRALKSFVVNHFVFFGRRLFLVAVLYHYVHIIEFFVETDTIISNCNLVILAQHFVCELLSEAGALLRLFDKALMFITQDTVVEMARLSFLHGALSRRGCHLRI